MNTATLAYRPLIPRMWLLHDAPSTERADEIAFHVKSGDYFSTLATILMLLEDSLADCAKRQTSPTEFQLSTLQTLKDELMHLHRVYKIVPKE